MISELLKKAREYEDREGSRISPEIRPVYHLSPLVGWMNDPNGFSWYQGRYHLFYQYYPYDTCWGPMHWGHAVSDDLVSWEYLPAAMAPDRWYDIEGCWSGSAASLPDGRHLLLYTGRTLCGENDIHQVQCAAIGDGIEYVKFEKNPVISEADLPEGASVNDFRDPKIWWDWEDCSYYMIVGSRAADGCGQILMYASRDGLAWDYRGVLDASRGQLGTMWECPDFFEIGQDAFLLLSPQEMKQEGPFQNCHGNVYIRGRLIKNTGLLSEDRSLPSHNISFSRKNMGPLDYGYDFYAAQTMEAPDGRRILIAWMQAWENVKNLPQGHSFAGMMTFPRELTVHEGRLYQTPVRELLTRRKNKVEYRDVPVSGKTVLPGVTGRVLDLNINIKPFPGTENASIPNARINLAEGAPGGHYYVTSLFYMPEEGTVCLDRSGSGYPDDAMPARIIRLDEKPKEQMISFRILMDRYSVEIFIDDGRYVMSSVIMTGLEAEGISFWTEGSFLLDVEKYDL